MGEPPPVEKGIRVGPVRSEHVSVPVRWSRTGRCSAIAVVALALLLWAPRLSGPIDLRWDAGVYYVLGTSLAASEGYRNVSEPGSPEALQYPPLLPALVALYQRALNSADPGIVAPWLRRTYAVLFVAYGLTTFALARAYLPPALALAATTFCLLHAWTIFFSDLLFAELPFALVSVGFALVAGAKASTTRLRETAAFLLAAAGFLLRTAGVALLAAWVIDALVRRRGDSGSCARFWLYCPLRFGKHTWPGFAQVKRTSTRPMNISEHHTKITTYPTPRTSSWSIRSDPSWGARMGPLLRLA